MTAEKSSKKLSASNWWVMIICLVVIISILLLNIINTRNLTQLRTYISSISNENVTVDALRKTNEELLEAENAFRIYVSTKDTLYSGKYISHIVESINNLKAVVNDGEKASIENIVTGLEQKVLLSNAIDQLKRIEDSIFSGNGNAGFYINPYWFKQSTSTLTYQFDSLRRIIDTTATSSSRKQAFLKKLDDIFSSKDNNNNTDNTANTNDGLTDVSKEYIPTNSLALAAKDVNDYYIQRFSGEELSRKIDTHEKALAQINLVIQYQINDALRSQLGQEELSERQKEENALNNAKEARKSIQLLSIASYVVIFFVALILVFNIYKNIKYEKEILNAREKAEKLAQSKSRFMSNMSHEIRSPLTSIIGFTEQMIGQEYDADKLKYLTAIRTSSEHLLTTVNDILDFSKLDAGKLSLNPQPFNIKSVVDEVLYAFSVTASKKEIGLEGLVDVDEMLLINADAFRLKQVLFNLTSNAVKFTEQGKVTIDVRTKSMNDKSIALEIAVTDTGVGIPADQLDFIFEEFSQATNTKKGGRRAIRGTGLGLAICKMLIELQGGTIEVRSELGKGSTFIIHITYPIESIRKKVAIAEEKQIVQHQFANKKALVVEDNDMNIMLLSLLLKKATIAFDVAKDGEQALQLYNSNDYDIVLTDINIPKITGDQVAANIRKLPNKQKSVVPIVALTASIIGDDTDQYFKMGVNDLLVKPFKEVDFITILHKYLD